MYDSYCDREMVKRDDLNTTFPTLKFLTAIALIAGALPVAAAGDHHKLSNINAKINCRLDSFIKGDMTEISEI